MTDLRDLDLEPRPTASCGRPSAFTPNYLALPVHLDDGTLCSHPPEER